MRRIPLILALVTLAVPFALLAQTGGVTADGWHVRTDRDGDVSGMLSFMAMGTGVHAQTGRGAGIFWRSSDTHTGTYTIGASFAQVEPSNHPNAYGLFFGGSNLSGDDQQYTYFVIREDGQYLIRKRAGTETANVVGWTRHDAINTLDANGRAGNMLTVEVGNQVRFLANGMEVATQSASAVDTDGIAGVRVNHFLNVHIDDLDLGM